MKMNVRYILMAVMILTAAFAAAAANSQKARIERDFRQLETDLSRLMYSKVLPASDIATMNRALYEFMRDNPGVVRILRANAAGVTVNDVSAGSAQSEASRNISAQRWFQHVSKNRTAYYSMDADDDGGGVALFYAWPLMTGQNKDRFAGAFAAIIDFTAQVALIDDAEPFQLAFGGRAFFQHEDWEDVDFNEVALEVRGARGVTIRTERPLLTRRDPRPASTSTSKRIAAFEEEDISEVAEEDDGESAQSDAAAAERDRRRRDSGSSGFSMITVVLVALLSILAAYVIFKYADPSRRPVRYVNDIPPEPRPSTRLDNVIVPSMAERQAPMQPTPPPQAQPQLVRETTQIPVVSPPPMQPQQPQVPPQLVREPMPPPPMQPQPPQPQPKTDIDAEIMGKMLKLMKDEFALMDKKMLILAQRISALEMKG